MQLRVAHVAQVAHEISANAEKDILNAAFQTSQTKLIKLGPHQIFVIQVRILSPAFILIQHSGRMRPLLVSER